METNTFSNAKEQIIQEAKDAGWEIVRRPDGVVDFIQSQLPSLES